MKRKDLQALLVAVNSTNGNWQYPIGNKELTEKIKKLEHERKIKWDPYWSRWEIAK